MYDLRMTIFMIVIAEVIRTYDIAMTDSAIVDLSGMTLRMTRNVPTDMTYHMISYDIRIPWRMTLRMAWYGQSDLTYDIPYAQPYTQPYTVAYALNRMPVL